MDKETERTSAEAGDLDYTSEDVLSTPSTGELDKYPFPSSSEDLAYPPTAPTGVPPTPDTPAPGAPPDGGLVAWTQVFASFLVNAIGWGFPGMFGVYQLYYVTELDLPGTQVAWIGSFQTFLSYLLCVVAGRLADAGYIRSTIVVGTFFAVFGTMMTSLATAYWQIFLAQGLCTGLGLGLITTPSMTVLNQYFSKKRGLAICSATMGSGAGSVIFPAVVQHLIPKYGFAWAVRSSGFLALAMCLLAIVLFRPLPQVRVSQPLIDSRAFRELTFVLVAIGSTMFFMALYFASFYINLVGQDVAGMPPTVSVQLLIIMSALSIPARPIAGFIADRWVSPINVFVISATLTGVALFGWAGTSGAASMYAFSVGLGLTSGAAQGSWATAVIALNSADPTRLGVRYGMMCAFAGLASLAGPPVAAAIVDAGQRVGMGYVPAQVWSGGVTILGAAVAWYGGRLARGTGSKKAGGGEKNDTLGSGSSGDENV